MSQVFRIKAKRVGTQDGVVRIYLPTAMGRAMPDGSHEFDAQFTDDGISLLYVGPIPDDVKAGNATDAPKWANGGRPEPDGTDATYAALKPGKASLR